jgi:hypothetical protein
VNDPTVDYFPFGNFVQALFVKFLEALSFLGFSFGFHRLFSGIGRRPILRFLG